MNVPNWETFVASILTPLVAVIVEKKKDHPSTGLVNRQISYPIWINRVNMRHEHLAESTGQAGGLGSAPSDSPICH